MPPYRPNKRKQRSAAQPLLNVSDAIDSILTEMLAIFKDKAEVTDAEIEHWHRDLQPFPIPTIEWAFDAHRRNGRFFPLYGEILDLCIAYAPTTGQSVCDAECRKRHGKGYGANDILWLLERYNQKRAELNRPLTEAEMEPLYEALDAHRGHKPQWRAA
jgi:hypothetical protein